jgi:Raf kinase inhibitor-like YbhB/YbcL family protein
LRRLLLAAALTLLAACGPENATSPIQAPENMTLSSSEFTDRLPAAITCAGEGRSPSMAWTQPPPTARQLVVELIDPDAPSGRFAHWLVYDIPPGAGGLTSPPPPQAVQGRNDAGSIGYAAPCPPKGQTHVYLLTVYAVELDPDLPSGLTEGDLDGRIRDHVIGMSQLEATFGR